MAVARSWMLDVGCAKCCCFFFSYIWNYSLHDLQVTNSNRRKALRSRKYYWKLIICLHWSTECIIIVLFRCCWLQTMQYGPQPPQHTFYPQLYINFNTQSSHQKKRLICSYSYEGNHFIRHQSNMRKHNHHIPYNNFVSNASKINLIIITESAWQWNQREKKIFIYTATTTTTTKKYCFFHHKH